MNNGNREIYETEVEILEKVYQQLQQQGEYITRTQLQYLYKVITKYITSQSHSPDTLGIVLPHLGCLYLSEKSILSKLRGLRKTKQYDRFDLYTQKLDKLYNEVPEEQMYKSIYFQPRLRNIKKLTNGITIQEVIRRQNNDYEKIKG